MEDKNQDDKQRNSNGEQITSANSPSKIPGWMYAVGFGAIVAAVTGYTIYKVKSSRAEELKRRKYSTMITADDLAPPSEHEIAGMTNAVHRYWQFALSTYSNLKESSMKFFSSEMSRPEQNSLSNLYMNPIVGTDEAIRASNRFDSRHRVDEEVEERKQSEHKRKELEAEP